MLSKKSIPSAFSGLLTPQNWKQLGRPRVIIEGEDVTRNVEVCRPTALGFAVLFDKPDGHLPAIERIDGIRRMARTFYNGPVELRFEDVI